MFVVVWNERPECRWTGQGYCEAPWLARKYDDQAEAQSRANRVNGHVVEWQDRRAEPPPEDCPF